MDETKLTHFVLLSLDMVDWSNVWFLQYRVGATRFYDKPMMGSFFLYISKLLVLKKSPVALEIEKKILWRQLLYLIKII